MIKLIRRPENPIILPSLTSPWEASGAFNGSVIINGEDFHIVYRALSEKSLHHGIDMHLSTIGYAKSTDGIHFGEFRNLIMPEEEWELYGCEDPRVTKIDDTYFIFYTALSTYPFSAPGIKIAVAITKDFTTIQERHLVTPFNAKAMALFPEKVNGKYTVILSAHTDMPPAKISIASFEDKSEIWSENYWKSWERYVNDHTVNLLRNSNDQVEVGAVPIKTDDGWLLIYSYIGNYFSSSKSFGIEAVLLDLDDPQKIIGRTNGPMILPETNYEKYRNVPNVVFPSGAVVHDENLLVYYGAADTSTCVATCKFEDLLKEIRPLERTVSKPENPLRFKRFDENPILFPIPEHAWERKAVFNPAALFEDGKTHLVYRAMLDDYTSTFGYASSTDGFHVDERFPTPIYAPREDFESKTHPGNSGCEDARIARIDDTFYMCYTAFDGVHPPRVAFTSIKADDFLNKNWNFTTPKLISLPSTEDKDTCLFPEKINNKFVFLHRMLNNIWIDFVDDLDFSEGHFLAGEVLLKARPGKWDSIKVGITSGPVKTENGWLLLYHGISKDGVYRVGALLLDLQNPSKILSRIDDYIFEPEKEYEEKGQVANVVFPCGVLIRDGVIFIYYGGADTVIGVTTMNLDSL